MSSAASVTRWISQLRSDDPGVSNEAARRLWQRYCSRLLRLARRNLNQRLRRREDEQDVLQSAYKSFCLRQKRGDFDLGNRDDLWQVLVTITLRKVRNSAKRHARNRRDYRREQVDAATDAVEASSAQWTLGRIQGAEPSPEEAAVFSEEFHSRLQILPEALRQIALWKLEGYTNEEISGAQLLNCSTRSVERKLELIRRKWATPADSETETEATK